MKKRMTALLAALLLAALCLCALAETEIGGDLVIQATKIYADANLKRAVGSVPKYTSVLVEAFGDNGV